MTVRHLFSVAFSFAAAGLAAGPANAQTAEAVPGDGTVEGVFEQELVDGVGESPKLEAPSLTIAAKAAPVIAGSAPLEDEERLTDYQTNALSAEFKFPLTAGPDKGLGLAFVADAGLKHNLDVDDDATDDEFETAWYGNARLEWPRGVRRFSPFVSYGYEKGFSDFFEDQKYGDHKVSAGVNFKTSRYVRGTNESMSFNLTASVERSWSTLETRERWTPRLGAELKAELSRGLKWSLTVTGERRIFDKIGSDQRLDWRLSTFAGLDFAKLVDPAGGALRELKFGVRWTMNESNVDAKDFSSFNLLPVVTVGTKIPLGD